MKLSAVFIILVSLLPFLSIFLTTELPHTSDGGVQIPRMAAFYTALRDGHVPVRWAGDLNYGYGLPLFNFIYHTPFYISSFFISLGIELIDTFKLVLLLSFLGSGIGMYVFAKEFIHDEKTAVIMSLLYQFSPYRFVETLTRGSVGGIYAYTFLPFTLYGILRLWKKPSLLSMTITILSGALMILSHNALALLFFGCFVFFTLLFSKKASSFIITVVCLVGSLGVSAYYWIPALTERMYTYGDLFMKDLYRSHFPPLFNFFIPNLFNSQTLRVAEINVHIGVLHTLLVFYGCFVLFRIILSVFGASHNRFKRLADAFQTHKILIFAAILLLVSFYFMNTSSLWFWEHNSLLRQFQFPWRFLAVVVFAASFLGAVLKNTILLKNKYLFHFIIALILIPTLFYWRPVQGWTYGATNEYFWKYPLNTTYFGETDLIWSAGPAKEYPKERIQTIEGKADIIEFQKKTHYQSFIVQASTPAKLVSHTQFYPGWKVYIDTKPTEIQFQDPNWRGLITFTVPQGEHTILIRFEETKIRLAADMISLSTILLLFCSWLAGYSILKKYKKNIFV